MGEKEAGRLTGKRFQEFEERSGFSAPAVELVEALHKMGGAVFADREIEGFALLGEFFQFRKDTGVQEEFHQDAQVGLHLKMFFATRELMGAFDGADVLKCFQALTGTAAADAQAAHEVVGAKRVFRKENEAENLADRARVAEQIADVNPKGEDGALLFGGGCG